MWGCGRRGAVKTALTAAPRGTGLQGGGTPLRPDPVQQVQNGVPETRSFKAHT